MPGEQAPTSVSRQNRPKMHNAKWSIEQKGTKK